MTEPEILRQAKFDPRVKSYWIWGPVAVLTIMIVTIPLAVLYALVASLFTGRYLASLECVLTERTLDIKKGIFNRTESTIPLDKITDLQLFQGPIMRFFGLYGFKVETAGQSAGPGSALVNLIGIVDTKGFRKAVLEQRDRWRSGAASGGGSPSATTLGDSGSRSSDRMADLLTEIRDSLQRIERSGASSRLTSD